MITYCPDKFKLTKSVTKAVDDCLASLKFIPNWFVTRKMLEQFHDALFANDDTLFFDEDFRKSHFLLMSWVFLV